ncbi:MAG: hypothetical protein KF689_01390 [Gemmatimonadaceae bacterium]|nr:hypothetical protein [Gemmatimonadaceae bacterium]MCW5826583.1 hypothetical protein [Gemmatimonadaceae bacterium]
MFIRSPRALRPLLAAAVLTVSMGCDGATAVTQPSMLEFRLTPQQVTVKAGEEFDVRAINVGQHRYELTGCIVRADLKLFPDNVATNPDTAFEIGTEAVWDLGCGARAIEVPEFAEVAFRLRAPEGLAPGVYRMMLPATLHTELWTIVGRTYVVIEISE